MTPTPFPQVAARQNPYPYYTRLRREMPVVFVEEEQSWFVSRYADAVEVLRRPLQFSSADSASFEATLIGADAPRHTRVRRLLTPLFTPRAIASIESTIRGVFARCLSVAARREVWDFVHDLAVPFPLFVMGEVLGMAEGDCERVRPWAADVALSDVPRTTAETQARDARAGVTEEFLREFVERCARRRAVGALDALLQARDPEERLTPEEGFDLVRVLLIAGNETTTNLLASTALALLRHPDQLRLLANDAARVPAAIEEAVRYDTPTQVVSRRTTAEIDLGGVRIPPHHHVTVLIGSANRDDAQFIDPDRFWIDRPANPHIGFGLGPHYCLGAHLARFEMRVALESLAGSIGQLRAAQPLETVEYPGSLRIRGPRTLMVSLHG